VSQKQFTDVLTADVSVHHIRYDNHEQ